MYVWRLKPRMYLLKRCLNNPPDACCAGPGDRGVGLKCVMRGAVENRVKIEVSHDVSGSNFEPLLVSRVASK